MNAISGWKSPTWGPIIHGVAVWLVTDGLPVLQYLQGVLTGDTATFDWNRFWLGLGAAVVAALISASRNSGAVTLTEPAGAKVKGIVRDGGMVVVTRADHVVANDETVLIPKR